MNEANATVRVLSVADCPGDYALLRLAAPLCAGRIGPGQHVRINGRVWAVMRAASRDGWLDCLQRGVRPPPADAAIALEGPLGTAFDLARATPRALLVGAEGGIAPMVFLADLLRHRRPRVKPLVLLQTATAFPFNPKPSRIIVPGLPAWVIAAMPLLEDWGVPSRLASAQELPGCFDGGPVELGRSWLDVSQGVADVTIFACGSEDVLAAARGLAAEYRLACQTAPSVPES